MTLALADYRSDLDALLATAVDSSTWTTAIKDEGLRQALNELNNQLVYEDDFEVQTTGYEQDLSAISAINNVLAVTYPWVAGCKFGEGGVRWRRAGHNILYFEGAQPADGETIRVRFTMLHTIDDLDSAAATTVPDQYRRLVGLWAAAYCCELSIRQISENPALPRSATIDLRDARDEFRRAARENASHLPASSVARWSSLGL